MSSCHWYKLHRSDSKKLGTVVMKQMYVILMHYSFGYCCAVRSMAEEVFETSQEKVLIFTTLATASVASLLLSMQEETLLVEKGISFFRRTRCAMW